MYHQKKSSLTFGIPNDFTRNLNFIFSDKKRLISVKV